MGIYLYLGNAIRAFAVQLLQHLEQKILHVRYDLLHEILSRKLTFYRQDSMPFRGIGQPADDAMRKNNDKIFSSGHYMPNDLRQEDLAPSEYIWWQLQFLFAPLFRSF